MEATVLNDPRNGQAFCKITSNQGFCTLDVAVGWLPVKEGTKKGDVCQVEGEFYEHEEFDPKTGQTFRHIRQRR